MPNNVSAPLQDNIRRYGTMRTKLHTNPTNTSTESNIINLNQNNNPNNLRVSYLQVLQQSFKTKALVSKTKHDLTSADVDLSALSEFDPSYQQQLDENLNVHIHDDEEQELDDDPYFEYNKCHTYTFLEKKLSDNFDKFEPVDLSTPFGNIDSFDQIEESPSFDINNSLDKMIR